MKQTTQPEAPAKRGRKFRWSELDVEAIAQHLVQAGVTEQTRGLAGEIDRAQKALLPNEKHRPETSLQTSSVLQTIRGAIVRAREGGAKVRPVTPVARAASRVTRPAAAKTQAPDKPPAVESEPKAAATLSNTEDVPPRLEAALAEIGAGIGQVIAAAILEAVENELEARVLEAVDGLASRLQREPVPASYRVGRVTRDASAATTAQRAGKTYRVNAPRTPARAAAEAAFQPK